MYLHYFFFHFDRYYCCLLLKLLQLFALRDCSVSASDITFFNISWSSFLFTRRFIFIFMYCESFHAEIINPKWNVFGTIWEGSVLKFSALFWKYLKLNIKYIILYFTVYKYHPQILSLSLSLFRKYFLRHVSFERISIYLYDNFVPIISYFFASY